MDQRIIFDEEMAWAFEADAKRLRNDGKLDIANWAMEMAHAYRYGWANLVSMGGIGLHMFRGLDYCLVYVRRGQPPRTVLREF